MDLRWNHSLFADKFFRIFSTLILLRFVVSFTSDILAEGLS